MRGYEPFALVIASILLAGCTSDPDAAVNQIYPIRQLDTFFNSFDARQPRLDYSQQPPSSVQQLPDYTHQPGYAPAYPPY